ncbi:hypothetical protein GV827_19610 [Sulfitobacter sp. JBTF-M27]|uniref:Type IV pilus biogenesis protein PilP n=2 Tax=Sulfitobacter sediminilitoris TaxID=2698830 RepID=A0A6P0CJ99_9RHOB|nr:hypothetical protein [Sulfitobacter sediminilitoris]NEK24593.1 hypothetical protein [Sulfitobacter sediminilitoris]
MKPSFALSLSFDGIRLLHRAAGGWRVVGEVGLESADMASELEVLRKTATALEQGGLRTKVLLPNEQIKYLSVETPGLDDADRRQAAEAALDGATPYAVKDLAFDISADGDRTHIAAVARETLAEAEAFAVEHRFNPVSFAAVPGDQSYLGEPFFGKTAAADDFLKQGETVEPDGIAVVVIGDIAPPEGPVASEEAAVSDHFEEDSEPVTETPETEAAAEEPEAVSKDAASKDEAVSTSGPSPADTGEKPAQAIAATSASLPDDDSAQVLPPLRAEQDDRVAEQASPPAVGFASRRAPDQSKTPVLGGVNRSEAGPATKATAFPDPAVPTTGSVTSGEIAIEPDSSSLAATAPEKDPAPRSGFLSRRKAKQSTQSAGEVISAPAAPALADKEGSEQERMTIFGARKTEVGGKPRFLGLILTAALLLFLAGVAAWASVFLDNGLKLSRLFGERSPETATVDLAPDPQPVVTAEPQVQTASLSPSLSEEDAAVLDALREPVQPVAPAKLSEAELEAQYATTGIWPRAPQVPPEPAGLVDIENLYLTSIDPVSTASDAIALPDPNGFGTDQLLASVSSPAAAGTQFALDADGFVIPTALGALSPDGFTVFLGQPPLVPPATPTRFQSEPEDTAIRSALAALRPQPRPSDLVENTERAQLDGLTRSELASFRPALRPQSLQQQAEAEAVIAPADTDEAVAAALATPSAIENATRFAVRASVRPDPRPRNFARIVQRAQRSTQNDEVRVASAAAVAPRVVQPKIPSKTSVAKQATVRNALNLRKVNLIGVYGKPSNRRALVRLGNGRYQKVVVGDRIDGGRVSAIGEGELRYTKRGRDLVLKMPR